MTPTTALPPSSLRNWLMGCMLGILAFGVCWTGAIFYWRAQDGDPGTGELMFYLFILPAALLAGALVARTRLGETAGAPPAPAGSTLPQPAYRPHASALPLAAIATAVRSPYGASVGELAGALTSRQARPTLDPVLVDDAGFPIPTVRCKEADDTARREEIAGWMAASAIDTRFDDAAGRALILATGVATDLAAHAATVWLKDRGTAPMLQLASVLPSGWTREQRGAASLWLQHTVVHAGWPAERVTIVPAGDTDLFDTVPTILLEKLATRGPIDAVHALVIACDSRLGETTPRPPENTAGEGAIGLLLTDPAQAAAAGGPVVAIIEPVHTARRDTSADATRGPVPPLLAKLIQQALDASLCDGGNIAMIAADTGPRPSRMLELMGHASTAMPQLDIDEDIVTYGHASGVCGAVPALTALALAGHAACDRNGPVLWIANDDPFQRCVAVVHPPDAI